MIKRTKLEAAEIRLVFARVFDSALLDINILENIGETYLTNQALNAVMNEVQEKWEKWKEKTNQPGAPDLKVKVTGEEDSTAFMMFNFDLLEKGNQFRIEGTRRFTNYVVAKTITIENIHVDSCVHPGQERFFIRCEFSDDTIIQIVYYGQGVAERAGRDFDDDVQTRPDEKWFIEDVQGEKVFRFNLTEFYKLTEDGNRENVPDQEEDEVEYHPEPDKTLLQKIWTTLGFTGSKS